MRAIQKIEAGIPVTKQDLANLSEDEFRAILRSIRGSAKSALTEEREQREKEAAKMSRSDLLREFGLDDV